MDDVNAEGGKAIMLKVSGAFHSRLMRNAEKMFSVYLEKVNVHDLKIPLVNNVEAKVITSSDDVKTSLVRQMSSSVLWWQSMQHFKDCDVIIEVGPGDKLSKLLLKQWPDKKILSVNDQKDIDQLIALGIAIKSNE